MAEAVRGLLKLPADLRHLLHLLNRRVVALKHVLNHLGSFLLALRDFLQTGRVLLLLLKHLLIHLRSLLRLIDQLLNNVLTLMELVRPILVLHAIALILRLDIQRLVMGRLKALVLIHRVFLLDVGKWRFGNESFRKRSPEELLVRSAICERSYHFPNWGVFMRLVFSR